MVRNFCLALLLALASACADSPEPPRAADHHAVIAAVLQSQPDAVADRRESHIQEGLLSRFFDHRICVESRTAGRPHYFDSSTRQPFGSEPSREVAWNRPTGRFAIAREGFPRFLRRASPFSICPSGTLRISNPQFAGDTARIFVELRCSDWCGGGGEIVLRKVEGRWRIQGWSHQWTA